MSAIRAIVFDLDDTLWEVGPVILRAEHAMLAHLERHYPRVVEQYSLQGMRDVRAQVALERPEMRHDFTWLRREALRRHATEAGYPEAMVDEVFEVFYRARNEVTLYDDALPALARLRGEFRLFAVSNGNADLAAIGLAHFFERRLSASAAGALKPDPRVFHLVLEGTGLAGGEVAHVGDDPHADVEGARRAGLVPVWLNRSGKAWPAQGGAEPVTIATLAELPQAVRSRQAR